MSDTPVMPMESGAHAEPGPVQNPGPAVQRVELRPIEMPDSERRRRWSRVFEILLGEPSGPAVTGTAGQPAAAPPPQPPGEPGPAAG